MKPAKASSPQPAMPAAETAPSANKPIVILGVDTAIRCTGYGVVAMTAPGKFKILDCGVIKNSAKLLHSECLRRLAGGIRELVATHHPTVASIEGVFLGRNIKTAMTLSLARGAVIATLAELGVPVFQYAPSVAKRTAVGRGDATKEQVALMMSAFCSVDVAGIPNDSTDALALAICHGNNCARPELAKFLVHPL